MNIKHWTILTGMMVLLCAFEGRSFADWAQFQGPDQNSCSAETGLIREWGAEGPKILWTAQIGPGYGGAAIEGGEVFIFDRVDDEKDVLRAYDLESGKENWHWEHAQAGKLQFPGSRSVPTVTADKIFVTSSFGRAFCIDRKTHQQVWEIDFPKKYQAEVPRWGYAQSPLLAGNLLILAPQGPEVKLLAVNPADGSEVWRADAPGESFSSPLLRKVFGETRVIYLSSGGYEAKQTNVNCFDPQTGKLLWRYTGYKNALPIPGVTMIGDDRMFLTGGYSTGSMLVKIVKGETDYQFEELARIKLGSQIHLPVFYQDHLYLTGNENGNLKTPSSRKTAGLFCVDLQGNEKWRTGDEPNFNRANIILADGLLLTQDGANGRLRLVKPSPEKFEILAEADIFQSGDTTEDLQYWAPMALSNGKLLMRSQSQLKCVQLTK